MSCVTLVAEFTHFVAHDRRVMCRVRAGGERVDKNSCVALYLSQSQAEAAVRRLQQAAFDIKKISLIGKGDDHEEHPIGFYSTGKRVKLWAKKGAFWGGVWGLLFGAGLFWIPGVGPVLMAGPLVAVLVATLESAVVVGGLSALGAALYSIGIPKESIIRYETALNIKQYLVVVHGSLQEVERAYDVLSASESTDVVIHLS